MIAHREISVLVNAVEHTFPAGPGRLLPGRLRGRDAITTYRFTLWAVLDAGSESRAIQKYPCGRKTGYSDNDPACNDPFLSQPFNEGLP
jgi:hypothetical protein